MSLPDFPTIDFVLQRVKRKLEDYVDDEPASDLMFVRMRKDDANHDSLSSASDSTNYFLDQISHQHPLFQFRASPSSSVQDASLLLYPNRIQFFVRMISESKTLVLHAKPEDTVKLIHEKIQAVTGIPIIEQRLIYCGRQLQWEHTLFECMITNDAGLHLVGRMRSTGNPQAWIVVDDLISIICRLHKGENGVLSKSVMSRLMDFLNMTPKHETDQAARHLNIFLSSCAPSALVMLYLSPYKGNKECAEESIRGFISFSNAILPKPLYSHCAPIVLEFCKLLGRVGAHDDHLYDLCRSSLGSMVEYVGVGKNSKKCDGHSNKMVVIGVQEILPFVAELAGKLSEGLVPSKQSIVDFGPLPTHVRDFKAFLQPLRAAIKEQLDFGGPVPMLISHSLACYSDEIKFLSMLFCDLMAKLQMRFEKVEDVMKTGKGAIGWYQYLAILKELHSISKLYQGAEKNFWINMGHYKLSLYYLIQKHAKRGEDYEWILEQKNLTNFECRRHLVMMLLPEVKDEYEELHEMLIDRSQLLAESFEYIAHAEPDTLRAGLFMEFKNEEATGPGVLREWFFLVCQEIFNPQNALFVACPNDRRRFFPNPASKVDPLHLEYFIFAGRVIALALMHKIQLGIVFERAFFLQLAASDVALEDIKDADPYLYSGCNQILDMDPSTVDQDALGLTFVREVEELGSMKVVELCPGGKSIVVNSRNRTEYVELLIRHRFVTSVARQVSHFARGFSDIVRDEKIQKLYFKSLELEDLDKMLHGSESVVSVEDWKAHTEYNGYKETDPQIYWFWKIVEEMTGEQRKFLLFFWTAIKYLPVEGFGGLASKLHIYKSEETFDRLPSSHTCFLRICFPAYPSMAMMQERLNIITQEHVGCSFGTW